VLSFSFHDGPTEAGAFHLFLYRDGRVLWDRWGASDGFQEQRLTSEGVDLVSSAALATGLLDEDRQLLNDRGGPYYADIVVRIRGRSVHLAWGDDRDLDRGRSPSEEQVAAIELLGQQMQDLRSWLPASAWEDATPEPFVATRYVVSFDWKPEESTLGLDPLLAALPDRAEDLLRTEGIDREEYTNLLGTLHQWEVEMTLDHVRTLIAFLERAGARPTDSPHGPSFELDTGVVLPDVTFSVGPMLPHEKI